MKMFRSDVSLINILEKELEKKGIKVKREVSPSSRTVNCKVEYRNRTFEFKLTMKDTYSLLLLLSDVTENTNRERRWKEEGITEG